MKHTSKLLSLPYELRLEIYNYLVPLDQPCDSLMGLLLSCQQIKNETDDVMRKEHVKVIKPIKDSWDLPGELRFPYPSRLFSHKELVIEAPYLSARRPAHVYAEHRGVLCPRIQRIAINIDQSLSAPEVLHDQFGLQRIARLSATLYILMLGRREGMSGKDKLHHYGWITIQFVDKSDDARENEKMVRTMAKCHGCEHTHHLCCTENSGFRIKW